MLENPPSPDVLREALAAHRLTLESGGDHVDRATGAQLHVRLLGVLERWDAFSAHEREELAAAVTYVARLDDDRHDLDEHDGLQDDAAQVTAVLDRLDGPRA